MKRSRDKKFETVEHGPFRADIRLDSETGVFSCAYATDSFQSTKLVEVRKWAYEKLKATCDIKWAPVMSVTFTVRDTMTNSLKNCSNLDCYIERGYIAWSGHKWVWAPWVVQPRGTYLCTSHAPSEMEQPPMSAHELACERLSHAKDFYPAQSKGAKLDFPIVEPESLSRQTYWIPYTDEHWATMLGIIDKMRELRQRIAKMLSTGTGWAQLAAIAGTKLLEAGNDSPQKLKLTDQNHEKHD